MKRSSSSPRSPRARARLRATAGARSRRPEPPAKGNRLQLTYVILSALVVCSLIAVALATVDFSSIFGGNAEDEANWEDPNADLIVEQQTAVAQDPDDVESILFLANLLGNTGRINEAVPYYERAVELAPNDVGVRIDFARSLGDAGLLADAEAQFKVALEQDPESQPAHYYLAELYRLSDPPRLEEAIPHYQRAAEIDETAFLAERARGQLTMLTAGTPGTAVASPEATP